MNRGYNVSDITPIIKVIWLHYSQFSHLYHGERQSLISKVTETQNLECNRLSPSFFFFLRFFWCGTFLKSLLNLSQYCFCSVFWIFGRKACGTLAPDLGSNSHSPSNGRQSSREVLPSLLLSKPSHSPSVEALDEDTSTFLVLRCESQGQGYREGFYAR